MRKFIYTLLLLSVALCGLHAQGGTCSTSEVLCNPNGSFLAETNVPSLGALPDCSGGGNCPASCTVFSTPNPAFYTFQIASSGDLDLTIDNANSVDIDFAIWGPFTDIAEAEASCGANDLPQGTPIDCSYLSASVEFLNIPNVMQGEVYIFLISNFSGQPTDIFFVPNPGSTATVGGPLAFDLTTTGPFDVGGPVIALSTIPAESDPNVTITSWSGPGVDASGNFDPSVAGVGVHTITVMGTSFGCPVTTTTQITVLANACVINCPPTSNYEGCTTGDIMSPDLPFSTTATAFTTADFMTAGGTFNADCDLNNLTYIDTQDTPIGDCPITITRTYSFTDAEGMVTSCTQSIGILDSEAPVIADLPAIITVECDAVPPMEMLTYTDCDQSNPLVTNEVVVPGVCANTFRITRTWSVTDGCGNFAERNQVIFVEDTTPPVAVCQDLQFILADPTGTITITAADVNNGSTDNCSAFADLTFAIDNSVFTCGTNPVTLSVTDECGNIGTCTSNITVVTSTGTPSVSNNFHCAEKDYIAGPKLKAKCSGGCTGAATWWDAPTGGIELFQGADFDPVVDGGADPTIVGCNIFYVDCDGLNRLPVVFEVISCDTDCTDGCEYYLVLEDAGFNGWDGASIDVSINEATSTNYKLSNEDCASSYKVIPLSVTDGALIDLAYWNGAFEEEHAWKIIDPLFNTIVSTGYDADDCNTTIPTILAERVKSACPTCCIDETEDYTVRITMGQFPEEQSWEIYEGISSTTAQGVQVIGINANIYTGLAPGSQITYDFTLNKCQTYTFVAFDGFNDSWDTGSWELITANIDYGTEITNSSDAFFGDALVLNGPSNPVFTDEDRVTFTIPCTPTCVDVEEFNLNCQVTDLDLPVAPPTVCYPNCNHALGCDLMVQHIVLPSSVDYNAIEGATVPYTGASDMTFTGTLPVGAHQLVTKYTYCDGIMVKCTTDLVISGDTNPVLTCNDNVIVALSVPTSPAGLFTLGECVAAVTPDMVLEMPDVCEEAFIVTILDANETPLIVLGRNGFPLDINGNEILTGQNTPIAHNLISAAEAGQTLTYVVEHTFSGNKCWGTITVEDKQAPVMNCVNYDIPCTHPEALNEDWTHTDLYEAAAELPANIAGGTGGLQSNTFIPINMPCAPMGEIIQNIQVNLNLTHNDVTDLSVVLHLPAALDAALGGISPLALDATGDVGAINVYTPNPVDDAPSLLGLLGAPCMLTQSTNPEDFVTENSGTLVPANAGGTWYIQIIDDNATFAPQPPFGGGEVTAASITLTCGFPTPVFAYDCTLASITLLDETIDETACNQSDWNGAVITRVWQAADAFGRTSTCNQTVALKAPAFSDLTLPSDATIECGTEVLAADGSIDPSQSGGPRFSCFELTEDLHGLCDISYTYEDITLGTCGSGYKVIRTWTIVNWCSGVNNTLQQTIKVEDNVGPVIDIANIAANTDVYECSATLEFNEAVTDACSSVKKVTVSYSVNGGSYGSNNAVVVDATDGATISGLPLGVTEVLISAQDECLNTTEELISITIADNTAPIATCNDNFNVSLGSDGQAWVYAEDIDEGSWDNCGISSLEVRRVGGCLGTSVWSDSAPVDCCDTSDPVTIELRVTDNAGNTNVCWQTVTVEDALAPTVECPDNVTVDCNDPSLHDLCAFGDAIASDNCSTVVEYSENDNRDQCKAGVITRTWNVDDNSTKSGSATCSQRITVEHISDFVVQFPADVTLTDCALQDGGEPSISNDDCELLAISSEDLVLTIIDDACYKIERTWTIVNWCIYDGDAASATDLGTPQPLPRTYRDDDGYFTYVQTIKVLDAVAPEITNPGDQTFCDLTEGCEGQADLVLEATDACSNAEALEYIYKIDAFNDGAGVSFDIIGEGNDASGVYPYGTHLIKWIVEDGCGNTSSTTYLFTVEDCKNPTPVCLNGITLPGMNSDGCVEVWASDLLEYAFDNCSNDELVEGTVRIRRIGATTAPQTVITVCCGTDGTGNIGVEVWVEDEAGNADYCTTYIGLQDPNNVCEDDARYVAGSIYTESGDMLEGVEVQLSGGMSSTMTTTSSGAYSSSVNMNADYIIEPSKDNDPLNGVSTFDLVLMSQHILGVQTLESPYQLIAADVNNDGNITTFDVVQTRQLILYVIQDFPTNTSWRFVDADYNFPVATNPWMETFPEVISYENIVNDQMEGDFISVKIGDVNGDAIVNSVQTTDDRSGNETLQFEIEDQQIKAGATFEVEFRANEFDSYNGYQFAMNFDASTATFAGVKTGVLNVTKANIGTTLLQEGIITTSWNENSNKGVSVDDKEVLFTLTFVASRDFRLSDFLSLTDRYTTAEAYRNNEMLNVDVSFVSEGGIAMESSRFELYQNQPNPFTTETTIGFYLPKAGEASISFYDVSGKVLHTINRKFAKGNNEVTFNKKEIESTGSVLYYRLDTEMGSAVKKMIILD